MASMSPAPTTGVTSTPSIDSHSAILWSSELTRRRTTVDNRLRKLNRILAISAGVLALAFVVQIGRGIQHAKSHPRYMAISRFTPNTLAETDKLADQVVIGKVANIRRGPDLATRVAGEPGGADRIPTEIVTLGVEKTVKGGAAQSVEVFRTGLSVDPLAQRPRPTAPDTPQPKGAVADPTKLPPPTAQEANRYMVHDDPMYQVGQRYLLFLTAGPEVAKGTKRVVSPEGRFFIGADNKLIPASNRAFAAQMRGKLLDSAVEDVIKLRGPIKLQPGLQKLPQTPIQPKLPPRPGAIPEEPPK